jgi:hypothetical protein
MENYDLVFIGAKPANVIAILEISSYFGIVAVIITVFLNPLCIIRHRALFFKIIHAAKL